MIFRLSIFMALISAIRAQKMAYMFVGQNSSSTTDNKTNSTYASKVYVYPDFTFDDIIISSNSLNCTESIGCSLSGEAKNMTFLNKTFGYVSGLIQINFIKLPFSERVAFKYVTNDSQNVTSILGLSKNSTFLNYYYGQNKKSGVFQLFYMNYENEINFVNNMTDKSGLKPMSDFTSKIYYNVTSTKWGVNGSSRTLLPSTAKVCLSNKVDMDPNSSSVMAVRDSAYQTWLGFLSDINSDLTDSTDTLSRNLTISLYNSDGKYVGDMVYYLDEFVGENKVSLIKPFTNEFDQGKNCDIYTGKLMLKKYKFQYYYVEQASGYNTSILYDLQAPIPQKSDDSNSSSSGFWWKLLLFLVIIGIIGYFAYWYFVSSRRGQAQFDDADYRSFPPPGNMTEMKENTKAEPTPKKTIPIPANENEKIPSLINK